MSDARKDIRDNKKNSQDSIDFKLYFFKLLSYWQLFIVSVTIGLLIARFLNGYRPKRFSLFTTISVKEETNSLFSTGTNLTFNWGGSSDLLETVRITLLSRTHNEKVVKQLQFYLQYLKDGKYRLEDVYGQTNFKVEVNEDSYQLLNKKIRVEVVDEFNVRLSFPTGENEKLTLNNYNKDDRIQLDAPEIFSEVYRISDSIKSDYFDIKIKPLSSSYKKGDWFYIQFIGFQDAVGIYRSIRTNLLAEGASIIEIKQEGQNKNRIVDYLNATVDILKNDKIAQKTLFARKTKQYIEDLFEKEARSLDTLENELKRFKKENNIYDLSIEGRAVFDQTIILEKNIKQIDDGVAYLNRLESYLRNNSVYDDKIPIPALITIEDSKIPALITDLIAKSTLRESLRVKVKDNHPQMQKLIKDIELVKGNIFENIVSLRKNFRESKNTYQKRLQTFKGKLINLPTKEQQLLNYQRNYNFSEENYIYLKQKSFEAGTAIEASISDVKVIDSALDLGQGPIYPRPTFNYLVGIMLGFILPLFYIITREILDNKVIMVEEIEKNYQIPILGVVGRNTGMNNLAVFERPKSSVAESFRALRSNIRFLLKEDSKEGGNTILFTSSVSGEGKTMISINMATVFALSGKKTVLLGLDLRKPKIYDDFDMKNDMGIVNYFINQKEIKDVVVPSKIPNLDIILSGPIPPNPSELLLGSKCDEMMKYLKSNYDYIIIDTPPVGLVSDALELFKYADATCYVIRQNYSEKGMMKMIDNKYINKEVSNISYIFNDFSVRSKYGYGYGYGYSYGYGYGYGYGGYGYSYGKYGNGYHENEEEKSIFQKILDFIIPKR